VQITQGQDLQVCQAGKVAVRLQPEVLLDQVQLSELVQRSDVLQARVTDACLAQGQSHQGQLNQLTDASITQALAAVQVEAGQLSQVLQERTKVAAVQAMSRQCRVSDNNWPHLFCRG
jgi:hypothetical protein